MSRTLSQSAPGLTAEFGRQAPSGPEQPYLLTVSLDAARREALRARLVPAMARAHRSASPLEAQFLAREAGRPIARDIFGDCLLAAARKHLAGGGVIIWDGLPLCDERASDADSDALTFGQALTAVIAQGTTQSFGFVQEDSGRHFQRLYPVAGLVHCGKTPDPLLPHLDNAMLVPAAQPEVIHLVCVNNDAQAATIFLSIGAVLRGLREGFEARLVDRLYEPAYVTALSNSFVADASAKSITTRARPILYRRRGERSATRFLGKGYDMGVAPGMEHGAEHEQALQAYQQVLKERQDLAYAITPLPGQAVSFHQQRLLHGRGPIAAGKHREMVRSYGRFDFSELLARIGHAPPDYIFDGIQLVDR
ncbi:MAG TPA: TauD/TfdA family dioxygenase [Pirellulales bacterium]|jgi:hypothetical protein|nr:TauD/TfdA family dioxygenase [Pirellulales bacterium]